VILKYTHLIVVVTKKNIVSLMMSWSFTKISELLLNLTYITYARIQFSRSVILALDINS